MSRTELLKKLEEIFRDILDDADLALSEESSQENLEDWDSLTHVTLFAVLEDELQLQFTMEEMTKSTNIKVLLDYLMEK